MSLRTFGIFLLIGSDAKPKVRGDCQENKHRGWIECYHGELAGTTSFVYAGGIQVQFPVMSPEFPRVWPYERDDDLRAAKEKEHPRQPAHFDVRIERAKAPPLLAAHAGMHTEFDVVKLDRSMQESADPELDGRLPARLRGIKVDTRPYVRSYVMYEATLRGVWQNVNTFGMKVDFDRMVESWAYITK